MSARSRSSPAALARSRNRSTARASTGLRSSARMAAVRERRGEEHLDHLRRALDDLEDLRLPIIPGHVVGLVAPGGAVESYSRARVLRGGSTGEVLRGQDRVVRALVLRLDERRGLATQ